MVPRSVLYADPDEEVRRATANVLADDGFAVEECATLSDAQQELAPAHDAVITEYDFPDGTGFDLLEQVRASAPDTACILFTDTEFEHLVEHDAGVIEYVQKEGADAHETLADLLDHSVTTRTQTAYPLPDDENDRLAALTRYTDHVDAADASLNRLTRLAAGLFDVPMATIGLIAEREQRFLSCRGTSMDAIIRESTVCTHAMLDDEVTVIEDVTDDPRFQSNQGLADLDIRFYASANVTTDDGHVLGTFCVYDEAPRAFAEHEREQLRLLADEAMEQLELRRRLREARSAEGGADA